MIKQLMDYLLRLLGFPHCAPVSHFDFKSIMSPYTYRSE